MTIELTDLGKRFRYDWIFKNLSYTFRQGEKYAVLGHNGSGKSTLLQIISGQLSPNKGKIKYTDATNTTIDIEHIYTHISYAAPYIELIEEFTLTETIDFHQKFKPFAADITTQQLIDIVALPKGNAHKAVHFFSSGMRQRLKLALAVCAATPVILLDEPTTNLDAQGVAWYRNLVAEYAADKLLIIASNIAQDYDFCDTQLVLTDYKNL
jgi:ABC-type multidrug transport system ATPase subunit